MNDFDGSFIDLVVNAYRRVKEASNVLALADHYPEVGKRSKYLAVVKKTFAESGGGVRIVGSDIVQNSPKVAFRRFQAGWRIGSGDVHFDRHRLAGGLEVSLLGIHSSFDGPVVLLDDVIQILHRPVAAATAESPVLLGNSGL